ncbi:MAG: PIG-L deacetylase family protein [Eubacteriales bacterium]|nr:PIG-L deacetylase family protein [Eubacteriales bacterium]
MRILAIGAHPDDCDLCFGGTAALYARAGHQVKFISATNGDTGHHRIGGGALARRRYDETQESRRLSGIAEYEVFDIHNNGLVADIPTRERFIRAIREWKPDVLFTHRTVDYHPDHRATAQLVQDSSYAIIIPNVCPLTPVLRRAPVICYFADRFRKPCPFDPQIVVDIDETVETKLAMFRAQESQVFEWLAYTNGNEDQVPADPDERDEWIRRETSLKRSYDGADRFRAQLIAKYGEERGSAVRAAEAFEISEYGRQPSEDEIAELFPF